MGIRCRVSLGVSIFLVGLVSLCAALALEPALAQDDGGQDTMSGDQNDNQNGDGNCPSAETVLDEFTGSGDQQTETFDITGESFRVTFDVTNFTDEDDTVLSFNISVIEDNGDFVDSISQEGEGVDSSIVNQAPGTFFLDVSAINVDYTITVEDCTGDDDGSDVSGDDNNSNDDDDANNDGVIDDTVPDKDLPDTGGSPLIVVGGVTLLSAFGILAAWRSKER